MAEQIESPPIGRVKSGFTTLTMATEETLRQAIQDGKFPPGSQLPPEMELISLLGVSRSTLREAMRTLEEQQLIVRKRGLGTYVSERPILKDLSMNFGITEMIRQAGMLPGADSASLKREKASAGIAKALQLVETDDDRRVGARAHGRPTPGCVEPGHHPGEDPGRAFD